MRHKFLLLCDLESVNLFSTLQPTKVFNNIHKYKGAETDEELGSIYKYKGAETDEEPGSIYKCKDTETSIKDLAANVDLGKARAYLYLDNRISAAYCSS